MLQKAKKFCGVLMALAILTTMLAGCDSKSNKSQNSTERLQSQQPTIWIRFQARVKTVRFS